VIMLITVHYLEEKMVCGAVRNLTKD
jgi:hypothetical protein